jgi:hypothetical protein
VKSPVFGLGFLHYVPHLSLLDNKTIQPDHQIMATSIDIQIAALDTTTDALCTQLDELNAKLDMIASNYATKADLANMISKLTWRMIAFGSLLVSSCFAIARYV